MTSKEFIIKQVSHIPEYQRAGINNIDETVDVFFEVLNYKTAENSLNGVGERVKSCIASLIEGVNYEGLLQILTTINLTEIYARKVLFMIDPDKFEEIVREKRGYFPILIALGFSKDQTSKMTDRRNTEGDHECSDGLSMEEAYGRINRFFLDYLKITCKKIEDLKNIVSISNEIKTFPDVYISSIIEDYEKNVSSKYLDVHWHDEDDTSVDCNIEGVLDNPQIWGGDTFGVKFLGEAGTGKTTALKRIQYCLAKKYKKNNTTKIPIYISLSELNQDNGALMSKLVEITLLNRDTVQEYMKNGDFVLLLDGYNEILDPMIQRNVAKEIDGYIRVYYGKTQIYISDRSIARNSIPVMTDSFKLFLRDILLSEKMEFFKGRISHKGYEIIKSKAEENEEYFSQFNTPLKMENLAKVIENEKKIPDDVTSSYIGMLFERERNENKEIGMDAIEDLLRALAIYIYQSKENDEETVSLPVIGRIEAMQVLANIKRKLGYSIENEHFERVTKGMLILNWENNCVGFTSREYLTYFMLEGIDLGIEEIVVGTD